MSPFQEGNGCRPLTISGAKGLPRLRCAPVAVQACAWRVGSAWRQGTGRIIRSRPGERLVACLLRLRIISTLAPVGAPLTPSRIGDRCRCRRREAGIIIPASRRRHSILSPMAPPLPCGSRSWQERGLSPRTPRLDHEACANGRAGEHAEAVRARAALAAAHARHEPRQRNSNAAWPKPTQAQLEFEGLAWRPHELPVHMDVDSATQAEAAERHDAWPQT